MVRLAGCLACLAMLLALPGLRTLCADSCPPAPVAEEPPCHEDRAEPLAPPPGGAADGCAHGDALSSTAARSVPDSAAAPSAEPVYSYPPGRVASARQPAFGAGRAVATVAANRLAPPLRC